ncbi:IPT/TIG domain-containing protein [Paenibacillus alkaliterrae]|uniref:alpha-amylase family glycosyl hydrolase n=1 Tax=Paenibacillus alkaliterrae TaxID=320909 RepID=UPI001F314466|nr:alpha-amylase family glycosyl hydrolase [Paenibacillus alkaliterrae]MCF2936828.1 IPT/TIG domain-containing protein [Paenibacillus alkaliterrae]
MRKIMRMSTAWMLSLVISLNIITPARAVPDTDYSNKQNFSTDVIYQVVTDRFVDGNSANNPTGAAYDSSCTQLKLYCGGDWQGIINKINDGYLTGMGITALWISQPVENITAILNYSGVNNTAYHGYWARDFKRTNAAFGSFTDFQNLIAAAHRHNIKVIIDFAPNHTSPASQTDSTFGENGKLLDNGTQLAAYSNDPNGIFHHNGGTDFSTIENGIYKNLFDLADLNHNNSTIDTYFKDAIKLWLDLGIDGIRWDAVKHMPFGWQKNIMSTVNNYKSVFSFGEWFLSENEVDPANHYFANESGMSLLDFEFGQKVRQVFRNGSDNMQGLDAMISRTAADYNEVNDQVTFIDNHDMDRFHQTGVSGRNLEQAVAFTLTSRGVPAIYYGTEQYMTGNGDPNNRAKMSSFSTTTTAYNLIKTLAPLRKSNPAIAYGTTQQRWINNNVYIYERKFGNNVALIAINRDQTNSANISNLFTAMPSGTYTDVLGGLLNGNGITVGTGGAVNTFTLGAGAVAVWQYTTASNTPAIGHVGPMSGKAGNTVTIDGRGFGATKGTVYFGTTAVTGANITSWEDTQIKVVIPSISAGKYGVKVRTAGSVDSNVYNNYEILTGDQVTVRFVVNNAYTTMGESVNLVGSVSEIGNWNPAKAIGSMYNQVVYQYPSWYYDVSVPAGAAIEFKFIKKSGSNVTWEGGLNHKFTAPTTGTATVNVNWQP